jgi:hypothetical protein
MAWLNLAVGNAPFNAVIFLEEAQGFAWRFFYCTIIPITHFFLELQYVCVFKRHLSQGFQPTLWRCHCERTAAFRPCAPFFIYRYTQTVQLGSAHSGSCRNASILVRGPRRKEHPVDLADWNVGSRGDGPRWFKDLRLLHLLGWCLLEVVCRGGMRPSDS